MDKHGSIKENNSPLSSKDLTNRIKAEAHRLGFIAVGAAKCEKVDPEAMNKYREWINKGMNGTMQYMERNIELREDPSLLLPGCKSIVMVAINYYPQIKQDSNLPQISYYAYGRDYHKVIKGRLKKLVEYIQSIHPTPFNSRIFTDSAPVMERYWAKKAGLGWIGKNSLLIIPKVGSFFFLGTLLLDITLEYDNEIGDHCGKCTRCIDHCPTKAITTPKIIDARRCISYLTIENKDEIPKDLQTLIGNRLYGCDTCQIVCPHNRMAKHTEIEDFKSGALLLIDIDTIEKMSEEEFDVLSRGSALRRAGLHGLKRTIKALKAQKNLQ